MYPFQWNKNNISTFDVFFSYLEKEEKLLQFVTDILTLRDTIPKVILVESLDDLTAVEDSRDSDHSLIRACATLSHIATCCSIYCNLPVYLLVTVEIPAVKLPPAVCSMFNSLWCFDSQSYTIARKLPVDSSHNPVLTLESRSDGALVLRQVNLLFGKSGKYEIAFQNLVNSE